MKLRHMAVAFLLNEKQEILLLQKKAESNFMGGFLVPVGGHIKSNESNDSKKACLREIEEETGLKSNFISYLKFRYGVLRIKATL